MPSRDGSGRAELAPTHAILASDLDLRRRQPWPPSVYRRRFASSRRARKRSPRPAARSARLIASLETQYPGIKERICDDSGQVRRFVNIFANDEDIRFLKNLETSVKDSDEISIVPAIAGG